MKANYTDMKKLILLIVMILNVTLLISNSYAQWVSVQNSTKYVSSFSENGAGRLYVTSNDGVYCSTNNGLNWSLLNSGIPLTSVKYSVSSKDSIVYLGTDAGVFRSVNYGQNWSLVLANTTKAVLIVNNYVFAGTKRSSDNGQTWNDFTNGLPQVAFVSTLSNDSSKIYLGLETSNGVYTSTNFGVNWFLTVNEINANAYSLYSKNGLILAGTANGVYISTNSGNNWRLINEIPGNIGLFGFASFNTQNIFISGWGDGVYRSTNMGINWVLKNEGLNDISCNGMLYYNNFVYCGTHNSIYRRNLTELIPVIENNGIIPTEFIISQNYPNPFNPTTTVIFSVPHLSNVRISIYDITGKEIEVLENKQYQAGNYKIQWNASNISSGIYFFVLESEQITKVQKMSLQK